jgi:hypothetical protein
VLRKRMSYCNARVGDGPPPLGMGQEPSAPIANLTLTHREVKWVDRTILEKGLAFIRMALNNLRELLRYIDDRASGISDDLLPSSADYGIGLVSVGHASDLEGIQFLSFHYYIQDGKLHFCMKNKQAGFPLQLVRYPGYLTTIPEPCKVGCVISGLVVPYRYLTSHDAFAAAVELHFHSLLIRRFTKDTLVRGVGKFLRRNVIPEHARILQATVFHPILDVWPFTHDVRVPTGDTAAPPPPAVVFPVVPEDTRVIESEISSLASLARAELTGAPLSPFPTPTPLRNAPQSVGSQDTERMLSQLSRVSGDLALSEDVAVGGTTPQAQQRVLRQSVSASPQASSGARFFSPLSGADDFTDCFSSSPVASAQQSEVVQFVSSTSPDDRTTPSSARSSVVRRKASDHTVTIGLYGVNRRDLDTLQPRGHFNDVVINSALYLLALKFNVPNVLSTFFYDTMIVASRPHAARVETFFLPLCYKSHWILVHYQQPPVHTLTWYDSISNYAAVTRLSRLHTIASWIRTDTRPAFCDGKSRQQISGSNDCGLFLLQSFATIVAGRPVEFTREHVCACLTTSDFVLPVPAPVAAPSSIAPSKAAARVLPVPVPVAMPSSLAPAHVLPVPVPVATPSSLAPSKAAAHVLPVPVPVAMPSSLAPSKAAAHVLPVPVPVATPSSLAPSKAAAHVLPVPVPVAMPSSLAPSKAAAHVLPVPVPVAMPSSLAPSKAAAPNAAIPTIFTSPRQQSHISVIAEPCQTPLISLAVPPSCTKRGESPVTAPSHSSKQSQSIASRVHSPSTARRAPRTTSRAPQTKTVAATSRSRPRCSHCSSLLDKDGDCVAAACPGQPKPSFKSMF